MNCATQSVPPVNTCVHGFSAYQAKLVVPPVPASKFRVFTLNSVGVPQGPPNGETKIAERHAASAASTDLGVETNVGG